MLGSYCSKRGDNTVNLVTSRKTIARLARPIAPALPLLRPIVWSYMGPVPPVLVLPRCRVQSILSLVLCVRLHMFSSKSQRNNVFDGAGIWNNHTKYYNATMCSMVLEYGIIIPNITMQQCV